MKPPEGQRSRFRHMDEAPASKQREAEGPPVLHQTTRPTKLGEETQTQTAQLAPCGKQLLIIQRLHKHSCKAHGKIITSISRQLEKK